jgi:L-alanine-DL-glutamate epimerase-like enolase superfamily enzyme
MKITHIQSNVVRLPAEEQLANGPVMSGATRDIVTLRIGTDEGIEGVGLTYYGGFYGGPVIGALKIMVDQLGAMIVGQNPLAIEATVGKLHALGHNLGPGGVFMQAIAAIDIALWDIKGKAMNLPLGKLVGGHRDRVITYASGALMRFYSLEQVVKAAPRLVEKGFRQMKMQLALPGNTRPEVEVQRARAIRDAIGPNIDLMCDINQRWSVHQAIDIGRRVEDVHLYWLEDVTQHDDYDGMARVSDALATPVAGGEYGFGIVPFRHMLEARSVDIVMIDLMRVGGITQWLKVAAMAEAFNHPVISHVLPELHVHLVAGVPNGLTVEYIAWSSPLWEEMPRMENGELILPDRPGHGLKFNEEVVKRYSVTS